MDPKLFRMYLQAMSGQKDASSAAFDPALAFMTGLYQPKQQFSENQLFTRSAPLISAAEAEKAGPRFEAAAAIRGGRAPWDVKRDISLRGNIDPKEWDKLVDAMFKENQSVKAKMLDLELEQDPFEKQGLPGYNTQYQPQDMYKFAPKAFQQILEGLPEAQELEDRALKPISDKYNRNVMVTDDKSRLDALYQKALSDPEVERKARAARGSQWKKAIPTFAKLAAKSELKNLGNKPILDEGKTLKSNLYGDYVKSLVSRKTGSASGKLKNAEKLAGQIQTELESQGRSPLYDAILRQAAMGGKLK
jgi:hypothetical protein